MAEVLSDKMPPQSLEAEQSILGGCLLDSTAALLAAETMPHSRDFYLTRHQVIYDIILDLLQKNEAVDILTVTNKLRESNKIEEVGGGLYLTELLNIIPTTGNIEYYCKIIRDKATRRRMLAAGHALIEMGYDEEGDLNEQVNLAESLVFDLRDHGEKGKIEPISPIVTRVYETIELVSKGDKSPNGVTSGFKTIDGMTLGFEPNNLIILAARPSMGKTALALEIGANAAMKQEKKVLIFSLEMKKEALVRRMMSANSGVNGERLRSGAIYGSEWPQLINSCNKIDSFPIWIDDSSSLTALEIRSKARRMKAKEGLDLVIIDYLQYIQMIQGPRENTNDAVGKVTRQLKIMAKELDLPVICLSQLSRKVEQREDKHPMMSDLRDSGSIEQDADVVMLLYREGYYKKNLPPEEDQKVEVIIAKQRDGRTGTVNMFFDRTTGKFGDLEIDREEEYKNGSLPF